MMLDSHYRLFREAEEERYRGIHKKVGHPLKIKMRRRGDREMGRP